MPATSMLTCGLSSHTTDNYVLVCVYFPLRPRVACMSEWLLSDAVKHLELQGFTFLARTDSRQKVAKLSFLKLIHLRLRARC
eukprot:2231389-Pyramimonas_sp.AAC.1